ncbi:MAG: radical SAM peptide maturase [Bacteroidales bacterium]|nr:radical SAM peptide maturase [Bacteroidales bacterium]
MNFNIPKITYRDLTVEAVQSQLANVQQITFEVTDACNLKCKYCAYGEFYEDYDKRENIMLPVEKAIRLLDYCAGFWNSERNKSCLQQVYISFYGGEPLMNMSFIETIVDYVQNKLYAPNRCFMFALPTNGILLDKCMDFLVTHRFNVLISLDGNADNDGYRVDHAGNESFERVVRNIELLRDTYPEYFEKHINFNAVLHNKNSVEGVYRFFKDRYDKIPNIGALNDNGIRPEMQQEFFKTYRNTYQSLRESANCDKIEKDMFVKSDSYRNVTTFLHQYSGFVFKDYNDLLYRQDEMHVIPTGTCVPFSKRIFLTVNGKILPCERIGQQHIIGRVTDDEILIDFEKVVERYNEYFKKITKQCNHCHNKLSCLQCIFNLDDLETTCKCYGFMNEQDFEQYVNIHMNFLKKHPEDYYRIMEEITVE